MRLICLSLLLLWPYSAFPWGKEGHRIINRTAARLMPAPLDSFFLFYSDSLALLGDAPDAWKKADSQLYNWHFIDLDLLDSYPFEKIPAEHEKALEIYGKEKLDKAGVLPWAVERSYKNLVRHYGQGRWPAVRDDLIGLAHYVGDGHQPLHVVLNYNGAQTGNPGVHFRFEIELLERFAADWRSLPARYLSKPAKRIASPSAHALAVAIHSFTWADSVNEWDIACRGTNADYDSAYYDCYRTKAASLMKQQLGLAASAVAAYWYSAWVEAGRPKLTWK